MEYIFEGSMDGAGFLILWLLQMLLICGFGLVSYVLRSLGVYTIAKNREIRNPWFAWLPVVDYYLLGCISDQYQYVVKGKVRNRRNVLLGLNIAVMVIGIIFFAAYIVILVRGVQSVLNGMSEYAMMDSILGSLAAVSALSLPMTILSIVTVVIRYIALYDLYTSCSPQNNVMFLVLSVIIGVTEPFFIFFIRNKEDGMPPRKGGSTPSAAPSSAAPETEAEPAPFYDDPEDMESSTGLPVPEPWTAPAEKDPWDMNDQE